ncbi:MAG: hypothetical protein QM688_01495 [Sphingomonas bacterium]
MKDIIFSLCAASVRRNALIVSRKRIGFAGSMQLTIGEGDFREWRGRAFDDFPGRS